LYSKNLAKSESETIFEEDLKVIELLLSKHKDLVKIKKVKDEECRIETTYNSMPVSEDIIKNDIDGKRFEFVGQVADESIRKKYVGKSVTSFYKRGEQNPIKYILKQD